MPIDSKKIIKTQPDLFVLPLVFCKAQMLQHTNYKNSACNDEDYGLVPIKFTFLSFWSLFFFLLLRERIIEFKLKRILMQLSHYKVMKVTWPRKMCLELEYAT